MPTPIKRGWEADIYQRASRHPLPLIRQLPKGDLIIFSPITADVKG